MSWSRAYGAFLGVLCADAAGATLEFAPGKITSDIAKKAMQMPGGGIWSVGRGQITDDSELALSLAQGLLNHHPNDGFPLHSVARKYREWWKSKPYDIGNTCRNAFRIKDDSEDIGDVMVNQSSQYNAESQANGSLMRILPLAIWASSQPTEKLAAMAAQEATLSHPHQVCQDCNAVYCLIVAHLIQHPGDREGALARAEAFVLGHVHSTARVWFLSESKDIATLDCSRQIGHVRWAFTLAIHYLRANTSYEDAIHDVLMKGGDTDTNAAIVGGLLGALHGVDGIPEYMKAPVLAFDCTAPNPGQPRPEAYKSSQLENLTKSLLELAKQ